VHDDDDDDEGAEGGDVLCTKSLTHHLDFTLTFSRKNYFFCVLVWQKPENKCLNSSPKVWYNTCSGDVRKVYSCNQKPCNTVWGCIQRNTKCETVIICRVLIIDQTTELDMRYKQRRCNKFCLKNGLCVEVTSTNMTNVRYLEVISEKYFTVGRSLSVQIIL
jgi:hypothetical protein